jgi:tetratricopeptide (TPR) repeat protein
MGSLADRWPLSLLGRRTPGAERKRLRDRLRVAPDDAAALVRLGALCRAAGDLAEALRLHGRARELQPNNPEALQHLAQDYEATGQTDAAIEALERLRVVAPDNVWVLERLRDLLAQAGRWGDAAEAQAAILGGAAGEVGRAGAALQVWCGLRARAGQAALDAGRAREAAAAAREVLRADPGFAPAYVLLGDTYLRLGRPGRAVRLWHKAYEATGHTALLAGLERAYLTEERPHRLIDFYHRALLRAPDDIRLRYRLARLCLRLEMLDEAEAELEAVARDAPAFAPALHDLAEVHRRRGHLPQALDYARRALAASRASHQAFRCAACGAAAEEWTDRCAACGRWNTLADLLPSPRGAGEGGGGPAPAEA